MTHRSITTLVVIGAVALAGCTAAAGFAPGELASLPTPGGAAPLAPPVGDGPSVSQSFKVPGLAPGDVLAFYAGVLPAQRWAVSTPPSASADVWRGAWSRGNRVLEVTAEPRASADAPLPPPASQLDLVLRRR